MTKKREFDRFFVRSNTPVNVDPTGFHPCNIRITQNLKLV